MSVLGELQWMLPPLAICLVLTGIHAYLGIHVLTRKVIFVDLALAQIAALGTTYAYLLGYDPRNPGDAVAIDLFSLGFAVAGAAIFAVTRMRNERVPQEAFIGIVYAMASALAILVLAKSSGESEHLKEMLVGNVLLVTWPMVVKTAAIYLVIGAFHFVFRKRFFEISLDPEGAVARGRWVRLWDFAFYASFGLVITRSVAVAGVLLVFSFLVVPAVVSFMFADSVGRRLGLAWVASTVCSAAGMLVSYHGDLPTGPSVVACFAVLLVLSAVAYYVKGAQSPSRAAVKALLWAAVCALLVVASVWLKRGPGEHFHPADFQVLAAALSSPDENQQIEAVHHLADLKDGHTAALLASKLGQNPSDRVLEHIVQVLPGLGDPSVVPALQAAARRDEDPFLKIEIAASLLDLHHAAGFGVLASVLESEPSQLAQQKAGKMLGEALGDDFGLAGALSLEERRNAVGRFEAWLAGRGQRVRWRPDLRRFE